MVYMDEQIYFLWCLGWTLLSCVVIPVVIRWMCDCYRENKEKINKITLKKPTKIIEMKLNPKHPNGIINYGTINNYRRGYRDVNYIEIGN